MKSASGCQMIILDVSVQSSPKDGEWFFKQIKLVVPLQLFSTNFSLSLCIVFCGQQQHDAQICVPNMCMKWQLCLKCGSVFCMFSLVEL